MNCPSCGEASGKYGKTVEGRQRYRCGGCRKTFSDRKPLPHSKTPMEKAVAALNMLLEGMSIRAASRLTGIDKDTVQRLMERSGEQCRQFFEQAVDGVNVQDIQCDEIWAFVGAKERTAFQKDLLWGLGDAYVFTAIDKASKLLICFHVGRRSSDDAEAFARKLAAKVACRPHISTDGYQPYHTAIPAAFGYNVDHGMLIKQYGQPDTQGRRRYSPARIIGSKPYQNSGHSDAGQICTSHVERHNLTVRMQNRRFTRLTNAFSKKWENHEAMFALFAAWYNFCRKHSTLKTTPAVAAGLASEGWTLERLLVESAKVSS